MSFILLGILNSQAAGAVGGGAYDLLETTVLGSDQSSVSFTSLNSTYGTDYKHLQIRATVTGASTIDNMMQRINNDSSASYADHTLFGNGISVSPFNGPNQTEGRAGFVEASSSNSPAPNVIDILDPFDASKNTTLRSSAATFSSNQIILRSSLYAKINAVDTFTLLIAAGANFLTGSRFSLYGFKETV